MTSFAKTTAIIFTLILTTDARAATIGRCAFDTETLEFAGTPIEQARCLLAPVAVAGKISDPPARLGQVLEARVGKPVRIDREKLGSMLAGAGLGDMVGTLGRPVSRADSGAAAAHSARYFVIHDISQKLSEPPFPSNDDPKINRLGYTYKDGTWVAHIFVNRLGQTRVGYDFEKPWRATKLESDKYGVGKRTRGLFLHVELNQPRLRDPAIAADNDRLAPSPGFTPAQYDRLALLYIVASSRAGRWIVPAYHAVVDAGVVAGGHDDPQNFDRGVFEAALLKRLSEVERNN